MFGTGQARRPGGRYPRLSPGGGEALRERMREHFGSVAAAARWMNRPKSSLQPLIGGSGGIPPEELDRLLAELRTTREELEQVGGSKDGQNGAHPLARRLPRLASLVITVGDPVVDCFQRRDPYLARLA